ncbi:MAG: GatB/YqeY domain-containing protein [Patescibacteria group bacterium]
MIKDKIKDDVKSALKAGDAARRTTLSTILSAVKNKELEKRSKLAKSGTPADQLDSASMLSDEEVIEVLGSEIKKRKESAEIYIKAGRPELAEQEKSEAQMLSAYMPEQLSEDVIREKVREAIKNTGAAGPKDMGKVIGQVMAAVKGQADGQVVSRIVKEELQ